MQQASLVLIQVCLNGSRSPDDHPALPVTPAELREAAEDAIEAGAASVHVHPRDDAGRETLEPRFCDAAVMAIRQAHPFVPISLSTAAWIEPDLEHRLALVRGWTAKPTLASVNLAEEGAGRVARILLDLGIDVEAGLASVEDVHRLAGSDLLHRCAHILIEPPDPEPARAIETVRTMLHELDHLNAGVRRLLHGDGPATWAVLRYAFERGESGRIGLEDTLVLPDGTPARDNAGLVRAAADLARECDREPQPLD